MVQLPLRFELGMLNTFELNPALLPTFDFLWKQKLNDDFADKLHVQMQHKDERRLGFDNDESRTHDRCE